MWWAAPPSGPTQQRRPMPLVATAPSRSASSCIGLAAEGVVHEYPALKAGAAADADVSAAVDRVGAVLPKRRGDEVGNHALGDAAAVDPYPWWPDHRRRPLRQLRSSARGGGMRLRRRPLGPAGERIGEGDRRIALERPR